MRTHKNSPGLRVQAAGLPWSVGECCNYTAFVAGRQTKSDLWHDLQTVRDRLAAIQTDPQRSKLARLPGQLQRRIETELQQAKGTL
jgi:hypothetical protein